MKLCSRLLMVFGWNVYENDIFGHLNTISGKFGMTHELVRWKPHYRLSIRVNWTSFASYYGSGAIRRNVYSSAVFTGESTSLHSNFNWTGSSSITHSWHQKTRDTGLPGGEGLILLRSLVLTQYRSVTAAHCNDIESSNLAHKHPTSFQGKRQGHKVNLLYTWTMH